MRRVDKPLYRCHSIPGFRDQQRTAVIDKVFLHVHYEQSRSERIDIQAVPDFVVRDLDRNHFCLHLSIYSIDRSILPHPQSITRSTDIIQGASFVN